LLRVCAVCPTPHLNWSSKSVPPGTSSTTRSHRNRAGCNRPSPNTFRMWTVLYWTRSSRTQFGVSLSVWRLAGDTLNITCNFLYCNHQVHTDFLINLYIHFKLCFSSLCNVAYYNVTSSAIGARPFCHIRVLYKQDCDQFSTLALNKRPGSMWSSREIAGHSNLHLSVMSSLKNRLRHQHNGPLVAKRLAGLSAGCHKPLRSWSCSSFLWTARSSDRWTYLNSTKIQFVIRRGRLIVRPNRLIQFREIITIFL
jgi:hypothetical protein